MFLNCDVKWICYYGSWLKREEKKKIKSYCLIYGMVWRSNVSTSGSRLRFTSLDNHSMFLTLSFLFV